MRRDYVASTSIRRYFGTKCPLGYYVILGVIRLEDGTKIDDIPGGHLIQPKIEDIKSRHMISARTQKMPSGKCIF